MFSINNPLNKLNDPFKLFKNLVASAFPVVRPGYWGSRYVNSLLESRKLSTGLFNGMHYVNQSVCGSIIPKYLGTYEIELISIFKELFKIPFTHIIDVGAAEGYYAVGCALKFPHSQIIAYEGTEEGRQLLKQVVLMNGVVDHIQIRGYCTPEDLKTETSSYSENTYNLLIMDVEGLEESILKLHEASDLKNFFILIELHDWVDEFMGDRIMKKFSITHSIEEIQARKRQFSDFDIPSFLPLRIYLFPSLLAFSWERPLPMRWLYLKPKTE